VGPARGHPGARRLLRREVVDSASNPDRHVCAPRTAVWDANPTFVAARDCRTGWRGCDVRRPLSIGWLASLWSRVRCLGVSDAGAVHLLVWQLPGWVHPSTAAGGTAGHMHRWHQVRHRNHRSVSEGGATPTNDSSSLFGGWSWSASKTAPRWAAMCEFYTSRLLERSAATTPA
jgi:hypothetical protein